MTGSKVKRGVGNYRPCPAEDSRTYAEDSRTYMTLHYSNLQAQNQPDLSFDLTDLVIADNFLNCHRRALLIASTSVLLRVWRNWQTR